MFSDRSRLSAKKIAVSPQNAYEKPCRIAVTIGKRRVTFPDKISGGSGVLPQVGNLTRIFALCHGRYWTFLGLATLTHQIIVQRVTLSAAGGLFTDRQAHGSPPH
ncbi:hypothetical protein EAH72_33880 [Pseudomonas caspiana]|nr:hypothetical protein EAH72_33880 [Pseudomonas caspiana]